MACAICSSTVSITSEELSSIGHATRLVSSIGLNRRGIYELPMAETHGFRHTLCVCYHMDKWASLCHGVPSNITRTSELNSIVSKLADVSRGLCGSIWCERVGLTEQLYLETGPFLSASASWTRGLDGPSPIHVRRVQFVDLSPGRALQGGRAISNTTAVQVKYAGSVRAF
jgi:hypothetical protein